MANLDTIYNPDDRTQAFENHSAGYLISLAGPGTGKTYSLLKRTEALTAQGVAQDTICYLTFIKEISKAFIQDYVEKFGQESYDTHKPRISTLHSLACRLLRHQGFQIGYNGVSILPTRRNLTPMQLKQFSPISYLTLMPRIAERSLNYVNIYTPSSAPGET